MLVLGRKQGEEVVIQVGDVKIVVSVEDLRATSVRLGFEAPAEARILRRELYEMIQNAPKRNQE